MSRKRWSAPAAILGTVLIAGALTPMTMVSADAVGTTAVTADRGAHRAPVLGRTLPGVVKGSYIVVTRPGAVPRGTPSPRATAVRVGGTVTHRYGAAIAGFSARLSDKALRRLRTNPGVAYIEADRRVRLSADQSGATWGLDRIDQTTLPLNGTYHYDQTGAGVTAYIIDTGILGTHSQFSGRVGSGYTAISSGGTTDCNGHGTHVAGTVGGTTYGVAKGVTLVPVRVLDCNGEGTNSGVIAGVNWVTSNHTTGAAVANMSLGGGASTALDQAVSSSISDGVSYAVAAGNDNANACSYSPARVPTAITVGATTSTDARASYSNYGSCLDIFAPGSSITSSWYTSTSATNTISGTSMATPHVAGAAALYLQAHPSASPATVASALVANATTGVVTSPGSGSVNKLLFTGTATTTPTDPPSGSNVVANPGFESGNTGWTGTAGVITSSTSRPAHAGSWKAWLNGYGSSSTETLSQTVTVPSGSATLSFWIYVDTAETTSSTAYDKLTVQVVGSTTTTLATYSNLNASGYTQKSFNLSGYAGQTVTLRFTGTEDSSLQTSFVLDDVSVS